MNVLPLQRACELSEGGDEPPWLIEPLWAEEAVGILGGEPKCCKSFLALDIAVSVASGAPCLRQYPARRTGPVLLYPAEDALGTVRRRLEGICKAAKKDLCELPIDVITAPRLLLDQPKDRQRLHDTVGELRPMLLILDPFIRLHRIDENAAKDVAPLLGYLRELQREFHLAVLLVHHARKGAGKQRPGQALRGSSDLHGWGDSNLYLRRNPRSLLLSVEHRAAASPDDIDLELSTQGSALALSVLRSPPPDPQPVSVSERILQVMAQVQLPISTEQLRKLCRMRTTTLCQTLTSLSQQGLVLYGPGGYRLPVAKIDNPVSFPLPPIGHPRNGNGKQNHPVDIQGNPNENPLLSEPPPCQLTLLFGETEAGSAGTQPAQG